MHTAIIEVGNKIDIRIVNQIENAKTTGEPPHIYKSQLLDFFENGDIEISMPSENGQIRLLPLGLRYELVFYTKSGLYRGYGEVKERYKTDNRFMLRVALHTPLNKYQRREYYRLNCAMEAAFYIINKEIAMLEHTDEIETALRESEEAAGEKMSAYVRDISGGGEPLPEGLTPLVPEKDVELPEDSYILVYIRLGEKAQDAVYPIVGRVISSGKVEDVTPAKYEQRVEFILKDSRVREDIIRFIFKEERKARRNRKG